MAAAGAASPAFGRVFLDRILSQRNPEWLTPFLLIPTAVSAAGILASLLQAVYLQKLKGKLESCTVSGIEMIESIKATGAENGFFARWAGIQACLNTSIVQLFNLKKYLATLPPLLQALSNVAVLILGVSLILRGSFTAGMLLAFQGFLTAFLAPSATLLTASAKAEEMRAQMERIDDVMGTRLVIAHRLSTIRQCDRILVMEAGTILEDGNYDTLMEKRGVFASLVERQQLDETISTVME